MIWLVPAEINTVSYESLKHAASEALIYGQLRKLKPAKAVGLSKIPARLIKGSAAEIAKPPTKWIHMSLPYGQIPNDWKVARVIPLFEGGKAAVMDNYRPTPILSTFSKGQFISNYMLSLLSVVFERDMLLNIRRSSTMYMYYICYKFVCICIIHLHEYCKSFLSYMALIGNSVHCNADKVILFE